MRTYRSESDKIREEVARICQDCYFGYRIEGEVYPRCDLEKDESCPEQDRIDEIYDEIYENE